MIQPEDDGLHRRNDDPSWNESSFFSLTVPDRDIDGFVYVYHRPNIGYTMGGIGLWDSHGDETYNCTHFDFGDPYPLASGSEMYGFTLPNGLSIEAVKPLGSYEIGYRSSDCTADLGWEAHDQPFAVMRGGEADLPEGTDDWGRGHFEQGGRLTGEIILHGETLTVDCGSFRDRSWGPRAAAENPRAGFSMAVGTAENSFCFWSGSEYALDEDPIDDVTDRMLLGWYVKDGERSPMRSGSRTVIDRDEKRRPLHILIEAEDELGRLLTAEGRSHNSLYWHSYATVYATFHGVDWSFDGHVFRGEEQEFAPVRQFRKYLRAVR